MKFSYFILLMIAACSQKKRNEKEPVTENKLSEKPPPTPIRDTVYFRADTIKNKPVGKGFYKNDAGDIFVLKRSAFGEDSAGVWSAGMFLDDEIKDSAWDNPGKLREYIDIETYTEDSLSAYAMDKKYVYWFRSSSDGEIRFLVHGADPATFTVSKTNADSARDKRYIYYEGSRVGKVRRK